MDHLTDEIKMEWDPEDDLRFYMIIDDMTSFSFDAESARQVAAALIEMADRIDQRIDVAVKRMQFRESD